MKTYLQMIVALALCLGTVSLHAQTDAQATPPWQLPADDQRCPSKWGAGDQRGSGNLMKPDTVLRAAKLIKTGEVFELGELLTNDPKEAFINGGRQFTLVTKPDNPKPNTRTENEELVVSELGQVGTQIDAYAHQMYGDSFYNCFKYGDIFGRNGYKKLGVENIGMLMSRGVLIDVAGLKGVDMLADTYVITADDLQQALAKEKLTLQPGDAVIINTGYGKLMGKDNQRYERNSPGISIAAGQWLVSQNPMIVGADNCCLEVRPSEAHMSLPIHQMFLIQYGLHILENMKLEKLSAARAYEFAFIIQPLDMKGATGSAVEPVAVR
jgi:kynurenine formamidase